MLESKSYIATPPGATIKEQLDDRGMTQKEFSRRMDMSEKHISGLINGKVHLTPDVAEKLEMVLDVPASFWNKLESIYREKLVKVKNENEFKAESELLKKYPYKDIVEWGMVPPSDNEYSRIVNLRKYFEVSNLSLIENKELMPVACRRLSHTEKSTYIMLTLAQYAKIIARDISVKPFSLDILKENIPKIRQLTSYDLKDFNNTLINILKSCGIALVYLPQIKGSFLHGITFYDNNSNKIVLGITTRGKYADRFWFSLFHEIAHIIQGHIYKMSGTSDEDEKNADSMAANYLIPHARLERFYNSGNYSISAIREFANTVKISIDIVIGRLQNDGKLQHNQFITYKKKYTMDLHHEKSMA